VENNSFDIIKVLNDDTLAWVEAADELSTARIRVWELLAHSPGEYIVFNQDTKTLVAHFSIHEAPQIPEWWRAEDETVEQLQPATAPAVAANDDAFLEEEFDDFAGILHRVLQPAVA
jgi:hypothetical protein